MIDEAPGRVLRGRPGMIHGRDPLHPEITRCGLKMERTRAVSPHDQGKKLCGKCYRLPTRLRVRT